MSPTPAVTGALRRVVGVLLFGLVTGVAGSLLAIGFVEGIQWLSCQITAMDAMQWSGIDIALLLAPVAGGAIVGAMVYRLHDRRSHSLTDLVFSVQSRENPESSRDGIINAFAAIIGMGSGASVGLYGPLAVMGANIGNTLARWTRVDGSLAIGCGVAAVISTAFSAPIAALVFVHEVILRHYSMRAFAPVTVASSTGFFINHYLFERPLLFSLDGERSVFAPEFIGFLLTGIIGAIVAIIFMHAIIMAVNWAKQSNLPIWLRPAVAGLGVGLMAQWMPEILGPGIQMLGEVIRNGGFSLMDLSLILLLKIIATALCLGFGFAGGAFSPALLIGVLYGVLMGHLAGAVFGDMSSGIAFYGLCGMVAVVSPVIGGPLTAILIVFELTHNYELTTAVMISVVFSNVVAYRLFGRSLFDRQLADRGFDLSAGRENVILQHTAIADYVTTETLKVNGSQTLREALSVMVEADRQECYVVDELSKYLGKLRLFDILKLERQLGSQDLVQDLAVEDAASLDSEIAANHVIESMQLEADLSVWQALAKMQGYVGESIPIVDVRGYFIGIIYQSALVAAYLELSESLRAEEHAG